MTNSARMWGRMLWPVGPLLWLAGGVCLAGAGGPHPLNNPDARLMLQGSWLPEDHHRIDFDALPRLTTEHRVISDVRARKGVNQHNYLVRYADRFWAMWSDGPRVEDHVGQVVKYATSVDGMHWDEPRMLTPYPHGCAPGTPYYGQRTDKGWRYIARGFWVRDGRLLALAALDEAGRFFGPGLALHAFCWQEDAWVAAGVVQTNAINNFAPQQLPAGAWGMSRRRFDYRQSGVEFLIGGLDDLGAWASYPVTVKNSALKAEEPLWWTLPDGNSMMALFRDNNRGNYLYRAFSLDSGRTWSAPAPTDFPDATSKIFGMRLSNGDYALISNPNPLKRDPMTIALSRDGMVFDRMFYLTGGRRIDYPHALEHEGYLYVVYAGGKQSVELERVELAELEKLEMRPAILPPAPTFELEVEGVKTVISSLGPWRQSDKSPDKYRSHYFYMPPGGYGRLTFTPQLPAPGRYEVSGWWNTRGSRHQTVPYDIQYGACRKRVLVDQRRRGGEWVSLGFVDVKAGEEVSVAVNANGFRNYVVADAVKFIRVKE